MRAAKVDDNQREIVSALRGVGATVCHLHTVGMGCPDLLVGWRGVNYLLECKDGKKPPSQQKLTPMQDEWHSGWKGSAFIVNSPEAALAAIGAIPLKGVIHAQ